MDDSTFLRGQRVQVFSPVWYVPFIYGRSKTPTVDKKVSIRKAETLEGRRSIRLAIIS